MSVNKLILGDNLSVLRSIPDENPPKVILSAEELEDLKYRLEANAESETGIDFFSWDFIAQ
jgi:hypothetical protein